MGIDYGLKRTGIAVTDPLQIIVQGMDTQKSEDVLPFIAAYVQKEKVDYIVVGYPFMESTFGDQKFRQKLDDFILQLKKIVPGADVRLHDERYSSLRAKEIILESGLKKKNRQRKDLIDRTSAIVILQEYLGHI